MANPLRKSERKREEPILGEPKLVKTDDVVELPTVQEFRGESVADSLIRARQQIGQDLRSIAEILCIRYSYLDAIERGQYENLPGATYAVGFVRTYAEYLGLDGDQIVDRFKSEVEGLDSQTKLHFPAPAPEGKMPGGAVFLVAALLFAGAYGVWFYLSNNGGSWGDLVAPVPDRLQEIVDGDAPTVATGTGATVTIPAPAGTTTKSVPAPASTAPAVEPSALAENQRSEVARPSASQPAETVAISGTAEAPAVEVPAAPSATATESARVNSAGAPQAAEAAPEAPAAPEIAQQTAETPASVASASAPSASAPSASAPSASAPPASTGTGDTSQSGSAAQETAQQASADSGASAPSEPLAIPAAPDNDTAATAFLSNHEPKVYGEENADARIVLRATQDAWVQVRDRQGTLLLTRVLRVGDTYRVPNQDDLTLLTGNAGGLEITVDGRVLAPLGPVGAVRRNIPLNPQALTSGTAQ